MAHDILLDEGANVGLTTLLQSRIPEHVHAFEPSPTTFQLFRDNVKRAGGLKTSSCICRLG